jgi:hypothetical protein
LALKDWNDTPATAEDVSESNTANRQTRLLANPFDDMLGYSFACAHDAGWAHSLIGRNQNEALRTMTRCSERGLVRA